MSSELPVPYLNSTAKAYEHPYRPIHSPDRGYRLPTAERESQNHSHHGDHATQHQESRHLTVPVDQQSPAKRPKWLCRHGNEHRGSINPPRKTIRSQPHLLSLERHIPNPRNKYTNPSNTPIATGSVITANKGTTTAVTQQVNVSTACGRSADRNRGAINAPTSDPTEDNATISPVAHPLGSP